MAVSEGKSLDPGELLGAARLIIVAGKGGVGKTTVSAALARAAARRGQEPLLVEVEGKRGLPAAFGRGDLDYRESILHPGGGPGGESAIRARHLTPDEALLEYLEDHGLRRISKRLVSSGALDIVSTAVPGIADIVVLGKIKQLERGRAADLIILDAPAAGHAFTFLHSARGLVDAIRVGPIHAQAADVLEMLTDSQRTQVLLVALPEETPVNELVETAYRLEDRVGVSLGPVIVNGVIPKLDGLEAEPAAAAEAAGAVLSPVELGALAGAARFRRRRIDLQEEQMARLADLLPLPQIHLPFLFGGAVGNQELDILADAFIRGARS